MSKIPAQLILEIQILNYCFIDHIPMEYKYMYQAEFTESSFNGAGN